MSATTHEPRCGMCRYPVRGLPTFRCPECGNDLRKVGIIATGVRSHATPWQRVGYWTLLFLVAAIPLIALADNLLRWRQSNSTVTLRSPNGKREVRLTVIESGYAWPLPRRDVQLGFYPDFIPPLPILVDVNGRTLAYRNRQGSASGGQLSETAIEPWLTTPADPSPSAKQEALDLLAMVKAAVADGDLRHRPPVYFEQLGTRYTGAGSGPSALLILAALLILWTIGALNAWRRWPRM